MKDEELYCIFRTVFYIFLLLCLVTFIMAVFGAKGATSMAILTFTVLNFLRMVGEEED